MEIGNFRKKDVTEKETKNFKIDMNNILRYLRLKAKGEYISILPDYILISLH